MATRRKLSSASAGLLREQIVAAMDRYEKRMDKGQPGDGTVLYCGGAHDALRDVLGLLDTLLSEPS